MISIIIPTYNELETIFNTLLDLHDYMQGNSLEYEVIVADNGSTDLALMLLQHLGSPWIKFVTIPRRAPGLAFSEAVKKATGDLIIQLDADLSVDLTFVSRAIELYERHSYDMLIGSKRLGTQKRSWIRVAGSTAYIKLTQCVFGIPYSDFSLGAKAYKRKSILDTLSFLDYWTGYPLELCLYLKRRNKTIMQIKVDCVDKRKSRFNLWREAIEKYNHLYWTYRCWTTEGSWMCGGME